MDIVSIKKLLQPEKPRPEDYTRFLQALLNGISSEAVEANERDLASFQQEVSNIAEKVTVHSTTEEIDAAVGFVLRAVAGYNRMAVRVTKAHVQELQTMLAMLTKTIAFLSESSKTSIEQLQVVERNLQTASSIADVRALRGKLNDCLAIVRSESIRLHDESQSRIAELKEGVERTAVYARAAGIEMPKAASRPAVASRPRRGGSSDDSLTGLPGRDAAESRIAAGISLGKELVVTLFVVDRFTHLSGRFGDKVGDEILLLVAQHLGDQLETTPLFKWSGAAFAAIMEAQNPLHEIERQMRRAASKRLEKTIEEDHRMVLLPLTCSFVVQKVSDADSLESIVENLDDFAVTKSARA